MVNSGLVSKNYLDIYQNSSSLNDEVPLHLQINSVSKLLHLFKNGPAAKRLTFCIFFSKCSTVFAVGPIEKLENPLKLLDASYKKRIFGGFGGHNSYYTGY